MLIRDPNLGVFQTAQKKSGVSDSKNQKYDPYMISKEKFNLLSNEQFSVYSPINPLLHLQQTIGNQAVQRLVRSGLIQTKIKVSRPDDIYEQEADRVAEEVIRMSSSLEANTPISDTTDEKLYCKCKSCEDEEKEKWKISRKSSHEMTNLELSQDVAQEIDSTLHQGGSPLAPSTRESMEFRFGYDFSKVRVHTDGKAVNSADSLNALAYTLGQDIVFGQGQYQPYTNDGRRLLAHELTHVIHQNLSKASQHLVKEAFPSSTRIFSSNLASQLVQRYEAHEHALFGGEKDKQDIIVINGVQMTYGEMISMGDFFEYPNDMYNEEPEKLKELISLIRKEGKGEKVTSEDWQKATRGRYLKLAEENISHFAPSKSEPVVSRNMSGINHKIQWELKHKAALDYASLGKKNEALAVNAFGDHFLTDAFSAGHLINKPDVMENFKIALESSEKQKKVFFDIVARGVFADEGVKSFVSQYETVERKGIVFHPNINDAGRFSKLLQAIYDKEPRLVWNAIAIAIHDKLNTFPGGVKVENVKGDKWELSGDGTLNKKTLEIGSKAVAQSRQNILNAFINSIGPVKIPIAPLSILFKSVWDYVPYPSKEGTKTIVDIVTILTDPRQQETSNYIVKIIKENIQMIIDELVKRNILKKA